MKKRPRIKQTLSLRQRIELWAEKVRDQASILPPLLLHRQRLVRSRVEGQRAPPVEQPVEQRSERSPAMPEQAPRLELRRAQCVVDVNRRKRTSRASNKRNNRHKQNSNRSWIHFAERSPRVSMRKVIRSNRVLTFFPPLCFLRPGTSTSESRARSGW